MAHPIGRNAKCPCGSGKKYKHCCMKDDREYIEDDSGAVRSVPISDELGDMLGEHIENLEGEFGRELHPDDALFPDVQLEHSEHFMVEGMKAAGVDPALIYAFTRTGLIISEENQHLISDQDRQQWQAAIDEYRFRHESGIQYPIGTVALYGPDDKVTTKIVAAVIYSADSDPILERFVGTGVAADEKVQEQIKAFFAKHEVTHVAATDRNMGCPHEEGEDFPEGEDCPFCPFWKGKQGSAAVLDDDAEPSLAEQEMTMQMLQALDPSLTNELFELAQRCETADEFSNMIMVGSCPACESENTGDCENDPEVDDPCIGRCKECGQLWCCDCGELFSDSAAAALHECPVWEEMEEQWDEPF